MGDEIRRGEMKTKMDTRKYATEKKDKKKTCKRSSITTPTIALDGDEFDLNQFLQDRLLGMRRSTCGN